MNKAPRLYWHTCHVTAWLTALLATMGCHLRSTDQAPQAASPNQTVLRVSQATNWPADLLVWMVDLGTNDFHAPRFTTLPYTDPYVIERGGGKGGIRLMSEEGRAVKEFAIPRREIDAIVRLRYDMDVIDTTDVVIGRSNITLIHTSFANAGVFTPSEVYVLPRSENCFDYLKVIEANAWALDDLKLFYPALMFYETANRLKQTVKVEYHYGTVECMTQTGLGGGSQLVAHPAESRRTRSLIQARARRQVRT
jgi:hypothetical protein